MSTSFGEYVVEVAALSWLEVVGWRAPNMSAAERGHKLAAEPNCGSRATRGPC
jgi:hypothetical protein